jgi:hypothetical protein
MRGLVRAAALTTITAVAALGVWAGSAGAAVVTIGSPINGPVLGAAFSADMTIVNDRLGAPGAVLTSPLTGAVVRWRVGGAVGGPLQLRVLTANPGGTYTATGTSDPATPANSQLQVFSAAVPIKAGQTIGLNGKAGNEIGALANPASGYSKWEPPLADGQTAPPAFTSPLGAEIAFNADILPVPTISLIGPATGSIAGRTTVSVAGTDFTEVKAVEFGAVPATSFTVSSEGLISAVAPAATKPGPVDVTVTTVAGKSALVAGDRFTYTACVVPKLKRKSVKADRKALKKAGCKLGKVTRKHGAGKGAKVTKQTRKPGTVLPSGSKVHVKVG